MSDPTERYLSLLEQTTRSPKLLRVIADVRADRKGQWGPTGTDAIAAELVACTLGARQRPELLIQTLESRILS